MVVRGLPVQLTVEVVLVAHRAKDSPAGHHVKGLPVTAHHAKGSPAVRTTSNAPAVRTALGAPSGSNQVTARRVGVRKTIADAPSVRDRRATQVGPTAADQQIGRIVPGVGIPPIAQAAVSAHRGVAPNRQCGIQLQDDAGRPRVGSRVSVLLAVTPAVFGAALTPANAVGAKRLNNRIASPGNNTITTK